MALFVFKVMLIIVVDLIAVVSVVNRMCGHTVQINLSFKSPHTDTN